MEIILSLLFVILGIVAILYGADFLVDGAVAIARKYKVSTAVIGLTIVAFGTSTPELAVSLTGAFQGQSDISLGNVLGSNTFNILAIVGISSLVRPLLINRNTRSYEIPFMVMISFALALLSLDHLFEENSMDKITRADGLILLFFFLLFIAYSFATARKKGDKEEIPQESKKEIKGILAVLMLIGGLVMLIVGSKVFLYGATDIAKDFGISEAVIGVTLAAIGTSLPELITSVVAVKKGQIDIAINNVVGSNIFNILFILGTTATINPLSRGNISNMDFLFMLGSAVGLLFFALLSKKKVIPRFVGVLFTIAYISYMTLLVIQVIGK